MQFTLNKVLCLMDGRGEHCRWINLSKITNSMVVFLSKVAGNLFNWLQYF